MKKKLIYVLILLCLGNLQAEYNPEVADSAKDISEIHDYLKNQEIQIHNLDFEQQKKIILEISKQKIKSAKDLCFLLDLEKKYFDDLSIFKNTKIYLENFRIYNLLLSSRKNVSDDPEMAKLRDDFTFFLLMSYLKNEKLFKEKYSEPKEIVNTPDFIPIPPGSTQTAFVSGMSPDSISDPVYREQYRKAYDKHKREVAEKTAYNDMHFYLKDSLPLFKDFVISWIYAMYSVNQDDLQKVTYIYNQIPAYEKEKVVMCYFIKNKIKPSSFISAEQIEQNYDKIIRGVDITDDLQNTKAVGTEVEK